MKTQRAYGTGPVRATKADAHNHFGMFIVSCDGADLRPMADKVMIYDHGRAWREDLAKPVVPRGEVIDELYDAVVRGIPPLHSGEWARATLEVCLAILESSRSGRDVRLVHQVDVVRRH